MPDSWRKRFNALQEPVEDDQGGDHPAMEPFYDQNLVNSAQSKVTGQAHWMAWVIAILSSI